MLLGSFHFLERWLAPMFATLGQIIPVAFVVTWIVVTLLLFFRTRATQRALLRRFPPVEGTPLDMVISGNPFGAQARAINQAMREHHADLEVEAIRREMWRRFRLYILWLFGLPLLGAGVGTFLILTGQIH